MERTVVDSGAVRYDDGRASFVVGRLRPGLVLAVGTGHDTGGLGDAPLNEFDAEIRRFAPIEIFVDATEVFNANQTVFERWARWMSDNRSHIKAISVLHASKFVHLTLSIAKLISGTGEMMRIYTDARAFEEAIARESGSPFTLSEWKKRVGMTVH